jgi:predicted RNase H-like nuclease
VAAVLGIDAAWTAKNASGYALVEKHVGSVWRLRAASSNLRDFSLQCGCDREGQGMVQAIHSAKLLLGAAPDLVAVDMPLSKKKITGRRTSDLAVSKRFGAAKCATHSPSAERPGKVSDAFRAACEQTGYALIVSAGPRPAFSLAEVYPHPALLCLMNVKERVPYKIAKTRTYWPQANLDQRLARVTHSLRAIIDALDKVILGVYDHVGPMLAVADSLAALKPVEDTIDAIICAWIGTAVLAGEAMAIGDDDSAIWIPDPFAPALADAL